MKAAVIHEFGGPEVLRYEDVPDPKPRMDQILVRVKACAMNHLDLWVRRGLPMGRIVRALNDHSVSQGVDYRPFMLLGNPDSKAIVADHRQFRTELASFSSARSTKKIIGTGSQGTLCFFVCELWG